MSSSLPSYDLSHSLPAGTTLRGKATHTHKTESTYSNSKQTNFNTL